jgi:hypothetical protein
LQIWHRAFAKIRAKLFISKFSSELQLFGTTTGFARESSPEKYDLTEGLPLLAKNHERMN